MGKFGMGKQNLKITQGQSLIEVLIAVAVGTVIITSLLGLATRANRNANFARAQGQASKLAQQGLEIVRNIETLNKDNAITLPVICADPSNNWTALYSNNCNLADPTRFRLVPPPDASCPITSWCLEATTETEAITYDNFNFKRTVEISDTTGVSACHTVGPPVGNDFDHTDSKQVTVEVVWEDPTGSHETKASTCINNL